MRKADLHRETADAEASLAVQKSQAQAIARGYQLYSSLLSELTLASGDPAMVDELETLLDQSNFEIESKIRKDKLNAIYHQVISLPARFRAAKNLSDMLAILMRVESQTMASKKSDTAVNRINETLAKIGQKVRKDLDAISKPMIKEE